MSTDQNQSTFFPDQPDAVDRMLAMGVPLHEIERLLDEADLKQTLQAEARPRQAGFIGRLLWT